MSVPGRLDLFARCQALQPIFTYRLQHRKSGLLLTFPLLLAALHQALVDQRGHSIEHMYCLPTKHRRQGLYRFERAATHEDGESSEKALLLGTQQIIAPLKGVT